MGHHAEDVAAFIEDAGDVLERAVGIGGRRDLTGGRGVAEGDAIVALESSERLAVAGVVAFHVADGHAKNLTALE